MTTEPSFRDVSKQPGHWRLKARQQCLVGDYLWKRAFESSGPEGDDDLALRVGCFSAALLHWGLAVENAAKAVLIQRLPSSVAQGRLREHDLARLIVQCDLTPSVELEELLDRLTTFVVWAGRYPTALSETDYLFQERRRRSVHPTDQEAVHDLIAGLDRLVARPP